MACGNKLKLLSKRKIEWSCKPVNDGTYGSMPLMCSECRSLTCKRRMTNLNGGTSQIVQQRHTQLDNEKKKTIKMNEFFGRDKCFSVSFRMSERSSTKMVQESISFHRSHHSGNLRRNTETQLDNFSLVSINFWGKKTAKEMLLQWIIILNEWWCAAFKVVKVYWDYTVDTIWEHKIKPDFSTEGNYLCQWPVLCCTFSYLFYHLFGRYSLNIIWKIVNAIWCANSTPQNFSSTGHEFFVVTKRRTQNKSSQPAAIDKLWALRAACRDHEKFFREFCSDSAPKQLKIVWK